MASDVRVTRLGDLVEPRSEKLKGSDLASATLPIVAKISFADGTLHLRQGVSKTDLILCEPGDLVISGINVLKGASALNLTGQRIAATIHYSSYRINTKRIIPQFLVEVLRSRTFREEALFELDAGVKTEVKPHLFVDLETAVPELDEQWRILRAIRRVDIARARAAREAVAARACLATARRAQIDDGDYPVRVFGTLLDGIEAGKSPKASNRPPTADEPGVLKVSAIRPGDFRPAEAKALIDAAVFPPHARVKAGDVLLSRANTTELVGACCRVDQTPSNLFLSDKTLRIKPGPNLNPDFIPHLLATPSAREQIEVAATGSSASMKNISQVTIKELEVCVPDDVDIQAAIAEKLNRLQAASIEATGLESKLAALRPVLVEALLSGGAVVSENRESSIPDLRNVVA